MGRPVHCGRGPAHCASRTRHLRSPRRGLTQVSLARAQTDPWLQPAPPDGGPSFAHAAGTCPAPGAFTQDVLGQSRSPEPSLPATALCLGHAAVGLGRRVLLLGGDCGASGSASHAFSLAAVDVARGEFYPLNASGAAPSARGMHTATILPPAAVDALPPRVQAELCPECAAHPWLDASPAVLVVGGGTELPLGGRSVAARWL